MIAIVAAGKGLRGTCKQTPERAADGATLHLSQSPLCQSVLTKISNICQTVSERADSTSSPMIVASRGLPSERDPQVSDILLQQPNVRLSQAKAIKFKLRAYSLKAFDCCLGLPCLK